MGEGPRGYEVGREWQEPCRIEKKGLVQYLLLARP